jgi:hypothetical protein
MKTRTNELSDKEKKLSSIVIWIWRNILASGVVLVCFGFLYNKCEQIEDNVIEIRTIVQERVRLERGDYGWSAPSYEETEITEEQMDKGSQIRQDINNFADEKE